MWKICKHKDVVDRSVYQDMVNKLSGEIRREKDLAERWRDAAKLKDTLAFVDNDGAIWVSNQLENWGVVILKEANGFVMENRPERRMKRFVPQHKVDEWVIKRAAELMTQAGV